MNAPAAPHARLSPTLAVRRVDYTLPADSRTLVDLLNAYAMAWRAQDVEAVSKVLEQMRAFNQAQPALAINTSTIRNSLQARMRYSSRAEGGVVLNPKIAAQAREQARFAE